MAIVGSGGSIDSVIRSPNFITGSKNRRGQGDAGEFIGEVRDFDSNDALRSQNFTAGDSDMIDMGLVASKVAYILVKR